MESKKIKSYISAGYLFFIGLGFIGGALFFGIGGGWDKMCTALFIFGFVNLIFGILAVLQAKGIKWSKTVQKILIWLVILWFVYLVVYSFIVTR